MSEKWTLTLFALGASTYLGACAHQQPAARPAAPPPAVTAAPAAPASPAPAEDQAAADRERAAKDLAALLRGAVIHFDFDAALLTPESRSRLQELADAMRARPGIGIKISGNCDDRGTEEYNLALGQKRAAVAKKYLADLGIDEGRIDAISYGEEKPVDARETEDAWAANRRDEFTVNRGL